LAYESELVPAVPGQRVDLRTTSQMPTSPIHFADRGLARALAATFARPPGHNRSSGTIMITVPADPGGGYVIARIETSAPSRPQMQIIPPSGQGVVVQAAPSFPGPSLQFFEVDADTTF